MAYEEKQAESRRVVVETPNARREVVHSETARYPDRSGVSGAALAAIVVGVIALAAIIILFVMNQQQNDANTNVAQTPPQTTIVQQPAQQPLGVRLTPVRVAGTGAHQQRDDHARQHATPGVDYRTGDRDHGLGDGDRQRDRDRQCLRRGRAVRSGRSESRRRDHFSPL